MQVLKSYKVDEQIECKTFKIFERLLEKKHFKDFQHFKANIKKELLCYNQRKKAQNLNPTTTHTTEVHAFSYFIYLFSFFQTKRL